MKKFRLTANRAVFFIGVVLATLYGGAKHTATVTYPRTDPETWYLMDSGSYVTNDAVHIAYTKNLVVPNSANIFIEGLELCYTNQSDWAEHSFLAYSNTLGNATSPFDMPFHAATNFNWVVYTDWAPGPATHTNGVAFVAWQIGASKPTNDLAMVRTGVYADALKLAPNPAITNGIPPEAGSRSIMEVNE